MYSSAGRMASSEPLPLNRPHFTGTPALIFVFVLCFSAGFAVDGAQDSGLVPEPSVIRRCLEDCLEGCISAGKRAELSECPDHLGASFSKMWAELIKSDLIFLENQTKHLILSLDSQAKNRGMDQTLALLAESKSRIEILRGIAHRFVSRCPVWATGMTPCLEDRSASDGQKRSEFKCFARSLLVELSKALAGAHSTQGRLRARQQESLSSLMQMRTALAAQKERLDAARSDKERALANIKSDGAGDGDLSAMLVHCRKNLLSTIRDAEVGERQVTPGKLPRRFPPPVASKPDEESSAECALGPTLAVAPRSPVLSVAEGRVAIVEYVPGFGLTIAVCHGGRDITVFSYLAAAFVCPGDLVKAGQRIGLSGESGLASGPSLLFALVKGDKFRDPRPRISWPAP